MSRIMIAAVLLLYTSPLASSREISGSTISLGAWSVSAYQDDATGAFTSCVASVPYKGGVSLVFSIERGQTAWRMGLLNPNWRLPANGRYPLSYRIDGGPWFDETGAVLHPSLIAIELAPSNVLFQLFRAGHLLQVRSQSKTFYFDLTNSSRALNTTLECSRYYSRKEFIANSANPFTTGTLHDDSTLKTEATTVLANLLGSIGVTDFRLVSDLPDSLKEYGYQVVWGAPGLLGGLKILRDATVADAATVVIAQQERECKKGAFGSFRGRSEKGLVSIRTACKESTGDNTVVTFNLVPRPSGGTYQFFTTASATSDRTTETEVNAANAVAGRLFDASLQTVEAPR